MQFLPIVERELRVASRQPKTWWRRVWFMCAGLVVFTFAYLSFGRWASSSLAGQEIFMALSMFGALYALLAGPLTTVDCLSRERREGTLGLLFLTDLKSHDVVLGKMAAASFDMVLGLTVALPLVAMPFLMGGVSLATFARVAAALASILFLSLAVGAFASSLFASTRSALAITLAILVFLTVGLPIMAASSGISPMSRAGYVLLAPSPFYAVFLSVIPFSRPPAWVFWLNLGCLHAMAWLCLAVACWRTHRAWRELAVSELGRRWRERLRRWERSKPKSRRRWRRLMLDRNPVAWLEGRDLLQERLLWGICLGAMGYLALNHLAHPDTWPEADWVVAWALWSHYILCLWIAIQAPRRFADDKSSGALELLLCTSLSAREIVQGNMLLLRRRFGRALLILLSLDVFLLYAHFAAHGGWDMAWSSSEGLLPLAFYALMVFALQAWCLARVGVYQGLVSSSRASFVLLGKIGVLPWVLFLGLMMAWDLASQRFRMTRVSDQLASIAWAGIHVLCCAWFLAHADCQLRRNFRDLAASSMRMPWWRRLARLRVRR